jgi:hypothetical protein
MAMIQSDEVETDVVMTSLKDLGNTPILWRGQTAGRKIGRMTILFSGVIKVTPEGRTGFRGALNDFVKNIFDRLGTKHLPVSCTFDRSQAKFFGSPGAVVPLGSFNLIYNPDIHDILSSDDSKGSTWDRKPEGDEFEKTLSGFRKINKIEKVHTGEILLDADAYYWITPGVFFETAKKSKFNQFETHEDIRTYADLLEVYKTYKSYLKWRANR